MVRDGCPRWLSRCRGSWYRRGQHQHIHGTQLSLGYPLPWFPWRGCHGSNPKLRWRGCPGRGLCVCPTCLVLVDTFLLCFAHDSCTSMMCISKTTPMSVGRSSSVIPNSRSSTRQYVHPATALWQGAGLIASTVLRSCVNGTGKPSCPSCHTSARSTGSARTLFSRGGRYSSSTSTCLS